MMMQQNKKGTLKSMLLVFAVVFVLFSVILTVFYTDFRAQGKGTVSGDELFESAKNQKGEIYTLEVNQSLTSDEDSWIRRLLSNGNDSESGQSYEDLRTAEYESADTSLTAYINAIKGSPKFIFSDLFGFSVGNEFLLFLGSIISLFLIYMYWDELKSVVTSLFGRTN